MRADSALLGLVGGFFDGALVGGGWQNTMTGHGTSRDKTSYGRFWAPDMLAHDEISDLFNFNDIAQRIVMAKPNEMFRRGWVMAFPGASPAQTAGSDRKPVPGKGPVKRTPPGDQPPWDPQAGAPGGKVETERGDAAGADVNQTMGESGFVSPAGSAIMPEDVKAADLNSPDADAEVPDAQNAAIGGAQSNGADLAAKVEKYLERLGHVQRLHESTVFGRAYGGGVLIIGADDGQPMWEPLDEKNIRSIIYLTWLDRRSIFAQSYYEEIGPKFGEPRVYEVTNPLGGQGVSLVHESRVLRFEGAIADLWLRRRLNGWTPSVLQAPYAVMRDFGMSFSSVANLMSDISQAVIHIQGLNQMISSDHRTLNTRMQLVDMARSSARMMYLDSETEKFERVATPLTGVADTLEMFMLRLSAAAEMPVALLFGREPSGLNATGDADFRRFYDTIAGEQKKYLMPKLLRLYTLACLAKDSPTGGKIPDGGIQFVFHKLYEPSELEQSQIRLNMAQADDKYIGNNTLLPEEVALSRFRSGDIHLDTEIQGDLRREKLATAELPPSGAEKAKLDQQNKQAELAVKASGIQAKAAGKSGPSQPAPSQA